ncbi:hypothetical protein, partial [Ruminococcus sp. Marseille-P6503]|uniref:hypothetical protein n=1 Tax=Ruminococcus sp. Marseille-P6503 TaxID=2364796 RepID=UPI0019D025B3
SDIASFPCEIMPILRDFNAVYRVLPHIHAFLLIYGFVCQITAMPDIVCKPELFFLSRLRQLIFSRKNFFMKNRR